MKHRFVDGGARFGIGDGERRRADAFFVGKIATRFVHQVPETPFTDVDRDVLERLLLGLREFTVETHQ